MEVYMQEEVIKTVELINKQVEKGDIAAVIEFDGDVIYKDFKEDIDYWFY